MVQVLRPPMLVPGAVDVEIFLGGFLAAAMWSRTSWSKISAPPPVRRIEAGVAQSLERLADRIFWRALGEMEDFDGGEGFHLQARDRALAQRVSMSV